MLHELQYLPTLLDTVVTTNSYSYGHVPVAAILGYQQLYLYPFFLFYLN